MNIGLRMPENILTIIWDTIHYIKFALIDN